MYLSGSLSDASKLTGTLSSPQVFSGIVLGAQHMSGTLSNATLRGMSAFEIAQTVGGFTGTEEDWLESLRAKKLEIRNNNARIEYKYENETQWTLLIDLSYQHDYLQLENKPSLDGRVLIGNRDLSTDYVLNTNALTNLEIEALLR